MPAIDDTEMGDDGAEGVVVCSPVTISRTGTLLI